MTTVQKAIFPGILFGILSLIGFAHLLANPNLAISSEQARGALVLKDSSAMGEKAADQPGECSISDSYPESVRQWCGLIQQYAQKHNLDPNLVSAVMLNESAGRADAYSKSGAVGLLQVMPRDGKAASFICPSGPCFANRPSSDQLFDPEFNVSYGTQMLAELIDKYGDIREALRAYGPMDVGYYYADLIISTMQKHE
jgi:soluble lytic murein transglycosylase-like protein